MVGVAEVYQLIINNYSIMGMGNKEDTLSPAAQTVLNALLAGDSQGVPLGQVQGGVWEEIRAAKPEVYAALRVVAE